MRSAGWPTRLSRPRLSPSPPSTVHASSASTASSSVGLGGSPTRTVRAPILCPASMSLSASPITTAPESSSPGKSRAASRKQLYARLAALADAALVRAPVDRVDRRRLLHAAVDLLHVLRAHPAQRHPPLVADHDHPPARLPQQPHGTLRAGQKPELLPGGDVLALGGLDVDGAVAVEERRGARAGAIPRRAHRRPARRSCAAPASSPPGSPACPPPGSAPRDRSAPPAGGRAGR